MTEDMIAVILKAARIRGFVSAVDGGAFQLHETSRDRFVGEEHELLDKLVGDVVVVDIDPFHFTARVEPISPPSAADKAG